MLVENSRKYLDYPPPADAKSLQFKGKDRKTPQEQSTGKGSADYACHFCGSVDHWIKDCPHKPTQMGQSTGSQQYGSQSQSSSSGNKGQSTKSQPRPQSSQKGDKGKGKGKGKNKHDGKKRIGKTPSRTRKNLPRELLTEKRRMRVSMKKKTRNNILIRKKRWICKKRRMAMTRMKRNGGIKSQKQNRLILRSQ